MNRGRLPPNSPYSSYAQVCVRLSVVSGTNLYVLDDISILDYEKTRDN
jgi:hypothetical protein